MEISAELQVALLAAVGALISLALSIIGYLQKRVDADAARAAADQALASAEQARLQREIAQLAAGEATQAKGEIVRLGMALGMTMEPDTDSGAPPPHE